MARRVARRVAGGAAGEAGEVDEADEAAGVGLRSDGPAEWLQTMQLAEPCIWLSIWALRALAVGTKYCAMPKSELELQYKPPCPGTNVKLSKEGPIHDTLDPPRCKTPAARDAAFRLLVALCDRGNRGYWGSFLQEIQLNGLGLTAAPKKGLIGIIGLNML